MSGGFEIGRVYNRRNDIHARFGGQQQGGISRRKIILSSSLSLVKRASNMAMPTASDPMAFLNILGKVKSATCS